MGILRFICIAAMAAVVSTGCATKGSVGSVSKQIEGLQKRVDELQVKVEKLEAGKQKK